MGLHPFALLSVDQTYQQKKETCMVQRGFKINRWVCWHHLFRWVHCPAWTTCKVMFCKNNNLESWNKTKASTKTTYMGSNITSWSISNCHLYWKHGWIAHRTSLNWHPLEYACRDVCTSSLNNDPSVWLCTVVIIMHAKLSASVNDTQLYLHFPTQITSPVQI